VKKLTLIFSIIAMVATGCAHKQKDETAKNTEHEKATKGAGIGAATGGILGGIIGQRSGDRNKGILIGAASGAALGGVIGNRMDKQAKELNKVAETKRTDEGLVTQLKNDILFDTGKATLKPEAKNNLVEMANIMKKYPENVLTVKGYADSTGSADFNESLSEKRAAAVRNVLVATGLPAQTISSVGYGEEQPVADNTTAEGRAKNRRVEIDVTVDPSKVPKQQ
jgi:outer membrane protein OmpA-like peptidoglycan-associated protein